MIPQSPSKIQTQSVDQFKLILVTETCLTNINTNIIHLSPSEYIRYFCTDIRYVFVSNFLLQTHLFSHVDSLRIQYKNHSIPRINSARPC
jgi:hypothetical protein